MSVILCCGVKASKCGIVEAVQIWMRFQQQTQLNQKCSAAKCSNLRGISKLDDANDTGTKNSIQRTLILTEGDSSKTLTTAGAVGQDCYSVSPLRGEVLNVREATHKQVDIYYCTLDSVNFDPSRCR